MIKYLKHREINKELWDNCITTASNGIIYGYSWYLDIVCEGWEALVNDDYTIVLPLTKGRKYLINYIYPPFFAQQLGVFSVEPISEKNCLEFYNAIPADFKFIEMNLHISNKWFPNGFTAKTNSDFILDLQLPYDEIRNHYSENHHRNCNKASRNGLSLFKFSNVDTVIEMFRKNRGSEIEKLKDHHYSMLRSLVQEAAKRKLADIWTVSDPDGIPCAGAVIFQSLNTSIFIFSAINSRGRNLSAMHYLIDNYIQENCLHKNALDFEGSNDPDLARFYKGFGSTEFVYLQIKKNQLSPPWSWFKK